MVKRLKVKKYLQRNIYITSVVKWTCSCFGLQHKPSTEANDMLFKICNPDSADDERRFFFGMSKYIGQLHVHYHWGGLAHSMQAARPTTVCNGQ